MNYDGIEVYWGYVGKGDSILIKNWHHGRPHSVLIDGGYKKHYGRVKRLLEETETLHLDAIQNTHPDQDHVGGLIELARDDDVTIGEAWKHRPHLHAGNAAIRSVLASWSTDATSTLLLKQAQYVQCSLQQGDELEQALVEKAVPIHEPFAGQRILDFLDVWGPTENYYARLLEELKSSQELEAQAAYYAANVATETMERLHKALDEDLLDNPTTSTMNNTSAITTFRKSGHRCLFTGDAGVQALNNALDYGQYDGQLTRLHAPHHGSRHNLDAALIDRLNPRGVVYSAEPNFAHHPHIAVRRAFKNRGVQQFGTWHKKPSPKRWKLGSVPEWGGQAWEQLPDPRQRVPA